MNWILGGIAIALLIFGLVGQAFEMRQIRVSTYRDEDLASSNIFMNKRNFKWYAMIGTGIAIWYLAQGSL
ncbi:MAG: hypothetical protein V3T67_05960 [Nitrosopumilaceae archaeon]